MLKQFYFKQFSLAQAHSLLLFDTWRRSYQVLPPDWIYIYIYIHTFCVCVCLCVCAFTLMNVDKCIFSREFGGFNVYENTFDPYMSLR